MTELHLAAAFGSPEDCTRVLAEHTHVNIYESTYGTPLGMALMAGKPQNAKQLLDSGATIDAEGPDGSTALFHVVCQEEPNLEAVRFLLKHGANVEHEDEAGLTVLSHISKTDKTAVARLLLEANADANHKSPGGYSPLHEAIIRQNLGMAQLLLDYDAKVDDEGFGGVLLFHEAVITRNVPMMEILLAHGAKVDAHRALRLRPIFHAIFGGDAVILQFLLDRGAAISCDKNGAEVTVFHAVAEVESASMMGTLLKHVSQHNPADMAELINQRDGAGYSPLHISAQKGDLKTVQALIRAGADVNAKDNSLRTPLYYAQANDKTKVRNFLLLSEMRSSRS